MKQILMLLLTIFSFGIPKAEIAMTAQYPDKIKFNGKQYDLNSNPLEPYFEKFPDKRPQDGMMSSALWRGYVAHFEIIDKQLFVTDIEIQVAEEISKDYYDTKWISVYDQVFPDREKVKMDWYTGILILPHGEMIEYVHLGYASTYSKYWLLEIDKGDFSEGRKYNNKEFVRFKKRQFEIFEKTEEYKKIYSDLIDSEENGDKDFIKSFIADYVMNYTSKFLTE